MRPLLGAVRGGPERGTREEAGDEVSCRSGVLLHAPHAQRRERPEVARPQLGNEGHARRPEPRRGWGAPPAAPPAGPPGLHQDARLGGGGRSRGHALSCTRPEPSSAAATRGPGGTEGAPVEMKQVRSAPRASGPPAREGTRGAQALSRRLILAVGAVRGEAQVNSDLSKDKAEDRNAQRPEQCTTAALGTTASPRGRRNRNTQVPPATRPAVHHGEAPRGQTPPAPSPAPGSPRDADLIGSSVEPGHVQRTPQGAEAGLAQVLDDSAAQRRPAGRQGLAGVLKGRCDRGRAQPEGALGQRARSARGRARPPLGGGLYSERGQSAQRECHNCPTNWLA